VFEINIRIKYKEEKGKIYKGRHLSLVVL